MFPTVYMTDDVIMLFVWGDVNAIMTHTGCRCVMMSYLVRLQVLTRREACTVFV